MNGRKAKLLRGLAHVNKESRKNTSYHGVESTVRQKQVTDPNNINADGTQVVLLRYTTATYALNEGARLLNKLLKKNYKSFLAA